MSARVVKISGETEDFSADKLFNSLQKIGASDTLIRRTIEIIDKEFKEGTLSSQKIYQAAYSILRKEARHLAARYSLKKALLQLGPSGYAFEKLIAEILNLQGFKTTTNVTAAGRCISHELDVVAEKADKRIFIECKFRNQPNAKVDVKTALYVNARYHALRNSKKTPPFDEFWLVTNNRFSSDAIRYARCEQLTLLGWNYPQKKTLQDLIYMMQVHPVTCLTTLSRQQKKALIEENIILCSSLLANSAILEEINLRTSKQRAVLKEIEEVINH